MGRSDKSKSFDLSAQITWQSNSMTLRTFHISEFINKIEHILTLLDDFPFSIMGGRPANIFHSGQKLLWPARMGRGRLIPDLEFKQGAQILPEHQLVSYLNAYWNFIFGRGGWGWWPQDNTLPSDNWAQDGKELFASISNNAIPCNNVRYNIK